MTNKSPHILQQSLALDLYLKTLLADEVSEAELLHTNEPVELSVQPLPKRTELEVKRLPTAVMEPVTQPKVTSPVLTNDLTLGKAINLPVKVEPPPKPVEKIVVAPAPQVVKPNRPLSVMPEWAQHEFQALFFKLDHLVLATPLTELSRTMVFNKKPTKIPIQPSWFLGLLEDHGKKVGVLDTGQLVFGKNRGSQRNLLERPFTSLLISSDGNWGLACDEILSISKIIPEKVRWRTFRKQRPWLIGTVIDELTAVIDITQLIPRKKTN